MNSIYRSPLYIPLGLLTLILVIYITFAGKFQSIYEIHNANYFSHLAHSFLNGTTELLNPPWDHDLSFYNNKAYLYWGPTPAFLLIPFVYLFGVNISDSLYNAIVGAFSTLFIYLILKNLNHKHFFSISDFKLFLLCVFFAFGTVQFCLAINGGVWFTSQVFSAFYLIISLYLLFKFLKQNSNIHLLFSSIFLGLAIWGRPTFIFYLPFFSAIILISTLKHWRLITVAKKFLILCLILFVIFIAQALYNYQRFGNFLESGYSYHHYGFKFAENKEKYGIINPIYIPHNFYYIFINTPKPISTFPYYSFDPEGNSIFTLSPLFFGIFLIARKKYWLSKEQKIFNFSLLFSIVGIVLFQLCFWGTGWLQFGARYLLDIIPLLILLLAQVIDDLPIWIILILVAISIHFNTLGALWMRFPPI